LNRVVLCSTDGIKTINLNCAITESSHTQFDFSYQAKTRQGEKVVSTDHTFSFGTSIELIPSLPDYSYSKNIGLLYHVPGIISDPQYIDNGNVIYLTNYNPGKYRVELTSTLSNSNSGIVDNFDFTILPPFYSTWWFRSVSVIGLFGLGFGINYIITSRKLKQAQIRLDKQEALAKQREKIADDLHDELGTELSRILYISDEAAEQTDGQRKNILINEITNIAATSIRNMRDMLWVLDEKNDSFSSLIDRIRSNVQQIFNEKDISFTLTVEGAIHSLLLDRETRQNILLIVKEACHNIIKHARASRVEIRIYDELDKVIFNIKDNGIGFSTQSESIGRGLKSMKRRANFIKAEMHFKNNNPNGTCLILKLPLDRFSQKENS
jgi:signal transduction histidine kinase